MAQYEMNLRDYWFIVRRRRVIIIMSTLVAVAFSFWLAQQKVPVYQTSASVKYEPSAAVSGLLVEVLSYSSADSIETQASIIKSTPVIEEVARQLGRLPDAPKGEPLQETKAYRAAIDAIADRLKVARVPNTSILDITATSTDPLEAKQLANTVAVVYKKYSRENRNVRITEARKFIEGQLKEVENRLKRAEDEVWAFRDANRIISPGAESTVLLSLFTQVRGDIEKTRQQRTELEMSASRLGGAPTSGIDRIYIETSNPAVQKLIATQNELMIERNNLALEVTDRHPRLQALDDRLREVRTEIRREVAAQIAVLRTREEILSRQLGELMQRNKEVPTVELGLARRQRDAKVNDDLLNLLKTRHTEALIKESEAVEEVAIVRPAAEPDVPAGGEKFSTVVVGGLLGLMLGLVFAFVQETLDTSIGTIEDVEGYLEVPVLGVVPHIDARETTQRLVERRPELRQMDPEALRNHALLITHFDPKSPVAEAYRTLRTNLQFARLERQGKLLVVTSPTLQEGKTTTIVNLALTMAQNGQKTLLLGCNLRRPSIYRFFGIEREPGVSDVLVGRVDWRACVKGVADILMGRFEMEDIMASPGLDNLHIIEAGPVPANPSELLSTRAMGDLLQAVRDEYDIVLIDTPPVLPVTDAAIVATQVDGVVLVYQAGKVGRLVLRRAKVHLESVGAKVWGIVLNDVHTEIAGYQYTHYYTHYYGEETPVEAGGGTRMQRFLSGVRAKMGRGGEESPVNGDVEIAADEAAPDVAPPPAPRRRSRRLPRLWLLMLGGVAVVGGAAAAAWQQGWIGPDLQPRVLLRQKLDRVPPAPPAPPRPAPVPPAAAPTTSPPAGVEASKPPVATTAPSTPAATIGAVTPAPPPSTTPPATGTPPGARMPVAATPPAPAAAAVKPAAPIATGPAGPRAASAPRFAVEFGPFFSTQEAERAERRLGQGGYQTVRFRQQAGTTVYAVLIERLPTAREAQALITALREQGFGEATVQGASEPLTVRVGDALPLRGAVQLAERLRGSGYQVRVAAETGEAITFVIRHGNFASREEADARSQELTRLGLPNQAVQVQ
jgi:capsular exopolysaccharide synthesis family protein